MPSDKLPGTDSAASTGYVCTVCGVFVYFDQSHTCGYQPLTYGSTDGAVLIPVLERIAVALEKLAAQGEEG